MGTAKKLGDDYILSKVALERLTDATHADAQIASLRRMGIPFGINDKGRPVVTEHALRQFTGEMAANASERPTINLAAINGSKAK